MAQEKHIHLIGICGSAMASLAGMLQTRGYRVTGSDAAAYPPMSDLLHALGIAIKEPYGEANLTPRPDLVIVGNAISRGNVELEYVLDQRIPFRSLAEIIQHEFLVGKESLVVAGTHGKTTTTSMLAWIYEVASRSQKEMTPSFLIGGIAENFGTSFHVREGKPFILEGDEYDTAFFDKGPKFMHYFPDALILTHVEFDHADIYDNLNSVKKKDDSLVVMNRNGELIIQDESGRERERYAVVYGAKVKVNEGDQVQLGKVMVEWDPYTFSVLTEIGGTIQFKDLQEGVTLHEEVDEVTGLSRHVVADSPDEKRQPAIVIKGKTSKRYLMPSRAHLMVQDGDTAFPGDVLAKIPRETTKTKDITGGLPRVVELFEARKPHETAVISEIDGTVKFGEVSKGQRKMYVIADNGTEKEYSVPRGVHINVQEGERVKAGEPLMDGPLNPHDILAVLGEKELQSYLVNEIQEVYRLQGVNISDKHIEVIVRQMMRWRKVEDVGDTQFLLEQQVDKFRFAEENERVIAQGGRPATGRPLLLGITKASLSTDSFISAASFQETTRVLTEASIQGAVDHLRGLKENVIVGRLIPAGTGMEYYRNVRLSPEMEEAAAKVQEEVSQAYEEAERALELMRHEGETEELTAE